MDTKQRPAGREIQDLKRNPSRILLDIGCICYKRSKILGCSKPVKTVRKTLTYESQNRVWNGVTLGLPAGQCSFTLRAGTDTLPTPLNLKRWKYKADARCTLCCNTNPTVHHILSNCPVSLNQGRFTWRHDCALAAIQKGIQAHLPPEISLIADLPGSRACEHPVSAIPDRILVTSARPDIVLITESEKKIDLLELTIPHNSLENISNARTRKSTKAENYQQALVT